MKYWKVKEFAQITGVSVRTLHHYDEIGLLKPKARQHSGYRLYSEDNLLKLQLILSLKSFGFELRQIKSLIRNNQAILESLKVQDELLLQKFNNLRSVRGNLRLMINNLSQGIDTSWEDVLKMIQEFSMDKNVQSWRSILTQEQRDELDQVQVKAKEIFNLDHDGYADLWSSLCEAVKQCIDQDPHGLVGKDLGIRWMSLVNMVYGANKELRQSVWRTLKEDNSHDKEEVTEGMNSEVVEWIEKAIAFHNLN